MRRYQRAFFTLLVARVALHTSDIEVCRAPRATIHLLPIQAQRFFRSPQCTQTPRLPNSPIRPRHAQREWSKMSPPANQSLRRKSDRSIPPSPSPPPQSPVAMTLIFQHRALTPTSRRLSDRSPTIFPAAQPELPRQSNILVEQIARRSGEISSRPLQVR